MRWGGSKLPKILSTWFVHAPISISSGIKERLYFVPKVKPDERGFGNMHFEDKMPVIFWAQKRPRFFIIFTRSIPLHVVVRGFKLRRPLATFFGLSRQREKDGTFPSRSSKAREAERVIYAAKWVSSFRLLLWKDLVLVCMYNVSPYQKLPWHGNSNQVTLN